MARTTGYTCTAVTRLVLDSRFSQTGIIAPEILGRVEGCRESVEKYLSERGVLFEIQRNKEK
jgi:saccharopine dehydrogenase-like NADP-dependent oxidoreductase